MTKPTVESVARELREIRGEPWLEVLSDWQIGCVASFVLCRERRAVREALEGAISTLSHRFDFEQSTEEVRELSPDGAWRLGLVEAIELLRRLADEVTE